MAWFKMTGFKNLQFFLIGEDTLVNEKKKIVESIRHDCDNELSEVML